MAKRMNVFIATKHPFLSPWCIARQKIRSRGVIKYLRPSYYWLCKQGEISTSGQYEQDYAKSFLQKCLCLQSHKRHFACSANHLRLWPAGTDLRYFIITIKKIARPWPRFLFYGEIQEATG